MNKYFWPSFEPGSSNEYRYMLYPVSSDWFERAQKGTAEQLVCSGTEKLYLNEKERSRIQSVVRLLQIFSNKIASRIEHRRSLMYRGFTV